MTFDLTNALAVNKEALDRDNYFASLVIEGKRIGILSEKDTERLQRESTELLKKQAENLVSGKSTSVRSETAQKLLSSVFYTVGAYLKTLPTPDSALYAIKKESLGSLFASGQKYLSGLLQKAKTKQLNLKKNLFVTQNIYYRTTAIDGLNAFFALYNPSLFADETIITADYPVFLPCKSSAGIEFIAEYIDRLCLENRFCLFFEANEIHSLLFSSDPLYKNSVMNIFGRVLISALFRTITDRAYDSLFCDCAEATELCMGKTASELGEMLLSAAKKLTLALGCSERLSDYVRECIPTVVGTIINAQKLGTLNGLFPYRASEASAAAVEITDGQSMNDTDFTALTEKLTSADSDEKISLLLSVISSFSDLLDILHGGYLNEQELITLFGALPEDIITLLVRAFPDVDFENDDRDILVCSSLRKYISAMPPKTT